MLSRFLSNATLSDYARQKKVIRKTFDIVATAATSVLTKMDVEQRKFSMRLMKVAVKTDPSAVQKALREVLRLPEERIQVLGKQELDQIEAYAIAITEDEQFNQPNISWDFWLIGNTYDDYIKRKLKTPGNPHGCALMAPKFPVHQGLLPAL